MKNHRRYVGCNSAENAMGKMVVVNEYLNRTSTIYFGTEEEMFDYVGGRTDANLFIREVNWESGALGGWQICKSNWG